MRVTCNICGGDNISQAASIMIDLSFEMPNRIIDWNDLQFEDFYYCKDCEDEVTVNEEE